MVGRKFGTKCRRLKHTFAGLSIYCQDSHLRLLKPFSDHTWVGNDVAKGDDLHFVKGLPSCVLFESQRDLTVPGLAAGEEADLTWAPSAGPSCAGKGDLKRE